MIFRKCEMIECGNKKSVGVKYLNVISSLNIDNKRFYFSDIRSSRIKKIIFKKNKILIKTQNTKYIFKEI